MSTAITTPTPSTLQTPNAPDGAGVAPQHGKVTWTEGADSILREEWSKATPAREIARILTERGFPQTKNGILGRAHRKGLPKHEDADKGRPRKIKPVVIRPDFSKPLAPTGCRYIHGDAAGWRSKWCDAPVAEIDGSWCAHHLAIVFRPKTMAEIEAAAGVHKNKRAA